jgi:hypothetical protein
VAVLLAAAPAHAADVLPPPNDVAPQVYAPPSNTTPPPGFATNADQAIAIAEKVAEVQSARRRHPDLRGYAYVSPLPLASGTFYHWDIYFQAATKVLVEVESDPAGRPLEIQTAPDIGWPLLRGYPGVLGGRLNAPWVWLPLCLLFIAPFVDFRRLRRLLHLDLLVLLGFGVSQFFFTRGEPDVSVPLVYPFLAYVVVRAVMAGFAPRRRSGPLIPHAPTWLLTAGIVALVGLRVAFGLADSATFDISSAGVIGADRIEHGQPLYEDNNYHGDTYGPVNYLMYVPFELISPYKPGADISGAARPATLFFDLLTMFGLFLLGRRLRAGPGGTRLGAALAYAWAALPYSGLVIAANTNDALVPLFVVYALLLLRSPPLRGALAGLASMAKFAPAAVAPVLIAGHRRLTVRNALIGGGVYVLVVGGLVWAFLPDGGLREFWNTTIGFQIDRTSPLSLWVRTPELDWLRPLFSGLAVLLALAATFFPRRRTTGQVAALCAAILAAVQIPANYWLYFYVIWFAPFLLVALFEEYRELGPRGQESVTSDFGKPLMISQPESVTATRSSMRTPSTSGR